MTRPALPLISSTFGVVLCQRSLAYDALRHSEKSDTEFLGRKGLLKLYMMSVAFHFVDHGTSEDGCCRSPRSKGFPCHSMAGRGGGLTDMKTAVNPIVQATKVTYSEHATHARILKVGTSAFQTGG